MSSALKTLGLLVVAALVAALLLSSVARQFGPVVPDSRCYKSQIGRERTGTDGLNYRCSRDGLFSNLRWRLKI